MEFSKGAAGMIAAACIAAGAGGAYFATSGDDSPSATQTFEAISPDPSIAAVEQSEAIITEAAPAVVPPAVERRVAPARSASGTRPTRSTAREPERPIEPGGEPTPLLREEAPAAIPPALEPARTSLPLPARAPEPPVTQFEELVVAADSVIGLQVESSMTSEHARVEDEVIAHVTRDVRVGDRVAIPSGARALGEVTLVERGGKVRDRARLGIRFTSVVLADGTRIPLETETIYREGDAPGGESAAKIGGGAIGGAIIGGLLGGAKGAAIGGSVGAGAGTAAVMAGGRNPATLPTGTPITVRVTDPVTVTVEK